MPLDRLVRILVTSSPAVTTAILVMGVVTAAAPHAAHAADRRDPRAVAVVDSVEAAMAPGGAWQKIAGLEFTFAVVKDGKTLKSYRHVWDTRSGMYRVEAEGVDGKPAVVIFDAGTRKGRAWVLEPAGAEVSPSGARSSPGAPARWVEAQGEAAGKLLEGGYGRFINDSYWLLMPLKMKDPGVNLDFEGERTPEGGEPCDVVRMTFNGVGLTPGDIYWVFVNRATHLVDRWEFVLEGQEAKDRSAFLWKDWRSFGPLRLAASHPKADGMVSIDFTGVAVLDEIPAGVFEPPR